MDNRQIDVLSAGHQHLMLALTLFMTGAPVTHYIESDGDLVLLTESIPGATRFTAAIKSPVRLSQFVRTWLSTATPKGAFDDYEVWNEPNAFRVWCGPWGRDEEFSAGICRVQARYAWLGK